MHRPTNTVHGRPRSEGTTSAPHSVDSSSVPVGKTSYRTTDRAFVQLSTYNQGDPAENISRYAATVNVSLGCSIKSLSSSVFRTGVHGLPLIMHTKAEHDSLGVRDPQPTGIYQGVRNLSAAVQPDDMVLITFTCHECNDSFDAEVENPWGTYEFIRCPVCGSARTTLAANISGP